MASGNRGQFEPGHKESAGRINARLTRGDVAPYRTRYIAGGESVDDLARALQAEFKVDTFEHAKAMLNRRIYGENWAFLRDRHREHVAELALAKVVEGEIESFSAKIKAGAGMMLDLGMEALTRLSPETVTEAIMLFREGREAGYRALGEPHQLSRQDVNLGGTVAVEHAHAAQLQGLSSGDFTAAARSGLAAYSASLDAAAAPDGGGDAGGSGE